MKMFVRLHLSWLLCVVSASQMTSANTFFNVYNCDYCPILLEKIGQGVNTFLTAARSPFFEFCRIDQRTEIDCMEAFDVVDAVVRKINREIFPEKRVNVSKHVMCSHVVNMCPDVSKNGKVLESGRWSCHTCSNFFEKILKLIVEPIERINNVFESMLCSQQQENCKTHFSPILQINEQLLDVFITENARNNACTKLMFCTP